MKSRNGFGYRSLASRVVFAWFLIARAMKAGQLTLVGACS